MYKMLAWLTGSLSSEEVEVPKPTDNVFLQALLQGHVTTYQSAAYREQVEGVTHETLACLMRCHSNEAFRWVLDQKKFDLYRPIQFANESASCGLLDRALKSQNAACFGALIAHNAGAVLSVSLSSLKEIPETSWQAFYRTVEQQAGGPVAALRYVNLKRRIDIKEGELEDVTESKTNRQREHQLTLMREKFDLLETELQGWLKVLDEQTDEASGLTVVTELA